MSAMGLTKVLQKLGFEMKRQQGSHMFFEHPDGRTTISLIIPVSILIEDF
jgi:predicted RNA binding protein YcfA (HicA-like mRNA interferase family)